MTKWVWWGLRGFFYSVVVFSFIYFFVYFDVIPNLWEGYVSMFTISNMIILSVTCGFIFSAIITFWNGNNKKIRKRN